MENKRKYTNIASLLHNTLMSKIDPINNWSEKYLVTCAVSNYKVETDARINLWGCYEFTKEVGLKNLSPSSLVSFAVSVSIRW